MACSSSTAKLRLSSILATGVKRFRMTIPPFVATGEPPRMEKVEAFAFHDASGRIRHMHHYIVLDGAEPRAYEAILDELKPQAFALGIDLGKLRVLHIRTPFNLAARHKVDVKRGVLVELRPPKGPWPPREGNADAELKTLSRRSRRR